MLALAASIHLLNTALEREDVSGRDQPDRDGKTRLNRRHQNGRYW
jgi:hypothetical protein